MEGTIQNIQLKRSDCNACVVSQLLTKVKYKGAILPYNVDFREGIKGNLDTSSLAIKLDGVSRSESKRIGRFYDVDQFKHLAVTEFTKFTTPYQAKFIKHSYIHSLLIHY